MDPELSGRQWLLISLDLPLILISNTWTFISLLGPLSFQISMVCLNAVYKTLRSGLDSRIRYLQEAFYSRSSPKFEYTELSNHQSIRLLSIQPGQTFHILSCTLQEASFGDEPTFVAVSYTWEQLDLSLSSTLLVLGSTILHMTIWVIFYMIPTIIFPDVFRRFLDQIDSVFHVSLLQDYVCSKVLPIRGGSRVILCNGRYTYVTSNLYALLLQLRQDASGTRYWIDAISINQANIPERNRHLSLMTQIYSCAQDVVAWLGPCSSLLDNPLTTGTIHLLPISTNSPKDLNLADIMVGLLRAYARARASRSAYFSRVWIVQECTLPKNITFMIGRFKFTTVEMKEAARLTPDSGIIGFLELLGLSSPKLITSVLEGREHYQETKMWTLSRYLTSVAGHNSTDKRDLIYAGLGLVTFQNSRLLEINTSGSGSIEEFDDGLLDNPSYSAGYVEVFVACGARLLLEEGLYALSFADNGAESGWINTPKLPTWVPNLNALGKSMPLRNDSGKMFAAGGRSKINLTVTPQNQLLFNSGAELLDTIEIVFTVDTSNDEEVIDAVLAILEVHPQICAANESIMTAIACSLTASFVDKELSDTACLTQGFIKFIDEYFEHAIRKGQARAEMMNHMSVFAKLPITRQHPLHQYDDSFHRRDVSAKQIRFQGYKIRHQQLNQGEVTSSLEPGECLNEDATNQAREPAGGRASNLADAARQYTRSLSQDFHTRTDFQRALKQIGPNRALFVTERGHIGLGTRYLKKGFVILIPAGSCMPYAMRETGSSEVCKHYRLYGEVYVHGIMNGERAASDDWNPVPILIE